MSGKLEVELARVNGDSSAPAGDGSEQLQKAHTCLITGRRPAELEAAEKEIASNHRHLRQRGQARGPRSTSLVQSNAVNAHSEAVVQNPDATS
jgi:hypothetical protein